MTDSQLACELAWQRYYERHNMLNGRSSIINKIHCPDRSIYRIMWIGVALFLWSLGGCAPQNEVINYRTYTDPEKGIFYIYDGVLDHAELISGVGSEQARVLITRQGN